MELQSITRYYDNEADIPARNDIELLRNNNNLLYLQAKTQVGIYFGDTDSFSKSYKTLIIDRDRLPMPEKEFLQDYNDLAKLTLTPILKPVEPIDADNPDVISEIKKVVLWVRGYPRQDGELTLKNENESLTPQTYLRPSNQPIFYSNRFPYNNGLFSNYNEFINIDDLFFLQVIPAIATNNGELLTRENFQKAISGQPGAAITEWLQWYDIFSDLRDKMFATYELFRTEQYDAIAQYDIATQYVAINNYFATFRFLGDARKDAASILKYKSKKYVLTNVSKALNIPSEIMTAAKKNNIPKAAPSTKQKTAGDDRTPIISKEITRQRTLYGNGKQLQIDFGNYIGEYSQTLGEKLTRKKIISWGQMPVETAKMQYEILYYVQKRTDFNCYELAKEINNAKSRAELQAIFDKTSCTIPISYLLKNIYGKVSGENRKKLLQALAEMPDELFAFGKSKKYFLWGKRFAAENWRFGEMENGKLKNLEQPIRINPIFFANILDENDNFTNYEQLTDGFMGMIRDLRNDDKITYRVFDILTKERDKRFAATKKTIKAIKCTARKNKEPQPTPAEISKVRQATATATIKKSKLQELVEINVGIDKKSGYVATRTRQAIETALQKIQDGGFLIKSYKTSGDTWKIMFFEP